MKVLDMNVMDMNDLEIKSILYDVIQKTHSRQDLLRYFDTVIDVEIEKKTGFWEQYTPEQRAELDRSYEESFNPDNWVSHEEVMAKYSKWSKK